MEPYTPDPQDLEVLIRARRIDEVVVIETRAGEIPLEMTLVLTEAAKLRDALSKALEN